MKIEKLENRPGHWSDCAVFNEPAGECDCGGLNLAAYDAYRAITSFIPTPRSLARFVQDGILPSLVETEDAPARRVAALTPTSDLPSAHDGIPVLRSADRVDFDNAGEASVADSEATERPIMITKEVDQALQKLLSSKETEQ
jgi:hypothetical protein